MKFDIEARKREAQGTGASRRLRNAGKVPGIVYGGDKDPVNLELSQKDMLRNLSNEKFHASILTLKVDGAAESVLLRAFNMHPWKAQVQHVDFQRVSKDRKIHMKVPLHFVNAETSPGVKLQGGLVSHVMNEINITCFPDDLPEYVEVDLGQMSIGNSVHVKDLSLPKGVEVVLHRAENPVVASVLVPKLITEEETAAADATPAAADVPATAQAAPEKAAEGDAAKAAEKKK
ncbi:MAG: 50S ribosomal protein L25/general stress protein Ctc [Burkholderiales bacterium]